MHIGNVSSLVVVFFVSVLKNKSLCIIQQTYTQTGLNERAEGAGKQQRERWKKERFPAGICSSSKTTNKGVPQGI